MQMAYPPPDPQAGSYPAEPQGAAYPPPAVAGYPPPPPTGYPPQPPVRLCLAWEGRGTSGIEGDGFKNEDEEGESKGLKHGKGDTL